MKLPSSNNVVAIAHGRAHAGGKHAKTGRDEAAGEKSENSSQVTVLFPRTRPAQPSQKTQKSQTGRDTGQDKQKANDAASGQDLFGSLFASVEQKLADQTPPGQNDEQTDAVPIQEGSVPAADVAQDGSGNSGRGAGYTLDFSLALLAKNFASTRASVDPKPDKTTSEPAAAAPATPATPATLATPATPATHATLPTSATQATSTTNLASLATPTTAEKVIDKLATLTTAEKAINDLAPRFSVIGQNSAPSPLKGKLDSAVQGKSEPATANAPQAAPQAEDRSTIEVAPVSTNTKDANAGEQQDLHSGAKPAVPTNGSPEKIAFGNISGVAYVQASRGPLLAPTAQIVENIRNAVAVPQASQPLANAAPQPVKTLEIELQPEGLGAVTVTLKSEQGKMKVQISAKVETTRQELERNSSELVNGLQKVDATFKDVDVSFSNQNQNPNQSGAQDAKGQNFSNGGERRATPEFISGSGSNGGQDASQPNAQSRNPGGGNGRLGKDPMLGDLPPGVDRADGIYL